MSGNTDKEKSKTPTTIKIAAKDASQRGSNGQADPGPGDPNAMPSEMPEPVSIPAPPSPSELVVKSAKSVDSRMIKTINNPVSLPKSKGSSASTALKSHKTLSTGPKSYDGGAPREPTSSKALSSTKSAGHLSTDGTQLTKTGSHLSAKFGGKSVHGSKSVGSGGQSGSAEPGASTGPTILGGPGQSGRSGPSGGAGVSAGLDPSVGGMRAAKTIDSAGGAGGGASGAPSQAGTSQATQADSQALDGQEQDVETEGETEIEHPSPSPRPSGAGSPASGGIDTAPVSSGGGMPKMGPKTSSHKSRVKSDTSSDASSASVGIGKKKKKKTTKFRYHKRVTVRTHGKTSPSSVMDKVNKKDHKVGITPSSIGEMDPEELMKRAGIKGGKKTHWRVRLRQTKRTTKDGKTTTQTRVAYRDSEGNKRIKTSSTPDCPKCGKKLEECRCDE